MKKFLIKIVELFNAFYQGLFWLVLLGFILLWVLKQAEKSKKEREESVIILAL